MVRKITFVLVLLGWLSGPSVRSAAHAQGVYPIVSSEAGYSGDGVDWILDQQEDVQFILFGEQHGIEGIPAFVQSVYFSLRDSGAYNLALEMDRWTVSEMECVGVEPFIQAYPYSVAFDFDGELELIESVRDQAGACSGALLWGLDQMVTSIHPFQRLAEIAPNARARRLARGASLKATLKTGEYLREDHFKDLDAIERAFGGDPSAEVSMILSDLRTSMDIYTKWRAGVRGEIPRTVSPEIRESLMKLRLDRYVAKHAQEEDVPKAVFKMGGAHTMYGVGPNGIETLGEHARKLAAGNGMRSLSLGIRSIDPESAFPPDSFFTVTDIILIDVEEYAQAQRADSTLPALNQFDDQFDALIYLKNASWASKSRINAAQNAFQRGLLITLGLCALLAVILLTSVVPAAWMWLKGRANVGHPLVRMAVAGWLMVALIGYQVYGFVAYPEMTAGIVGAGISFWVLACWTAVVLYVLFLALTEWRKQLYSRSMRIYLSMLSVSSAGLCWFAWTYNIGGMLG